MDLDTAIRRRRMCRDFLEEPVPREVLDRLLDRARRAPSAGYTQGVAFLVLEGTEQTRKFWRLAAEPGWLCDPDHPGLPKAPVIVVPLHSEAAYRRRYAEADKAAFGLAQAPVLGGREPHLGGRERPPAKVFWPAPFWLVDCAFATMLLLLGAAAEGLGALFFGLRGDPATLLDSFGVPEEWSAIGAVALGWPAPSERPSGSAAARRRKPLEEVVHRGGW